MLMETQFQQVIQLIQTSRTKAISAVNTELIHLYWNVGAYISQQLQQANWGENTVGELAAFIKKHHPEIKGFERRGLYRMKLFYEIYSNSTIVAPVVRQLQKTNNQKQYNCVTSGDTIRFSSSKGLPTNQNKLDKPSYNYVKM
jgi:hypothetical protein